MWSYHNIKLLTKKPSTGALKREYFQYFQRKNLLQHFRGIPDQMILSVYFIRTSKAVQWPPEGLRSILIRQYQVWPPDPIFFLFPLWSKQIIGLSGAQILHTRAGEDYSHTCQWIAFWEAEGCFLRGWRNQRKVSLQSDPTTMVFCGKMNRKKR